MNSSMFENIKDMNIAFGNPQGDCKNINWNRVHKQCLNIPDEVGEMFIALGCDPVLIKPAIALLKAVATYPINDVDVDKVRDSLIDNHVFTYGAHHLMGIDADQDSWTVLDGIYSRFVKNDDDKAATIAKHAANGITDVYFEGKYPKMIMKSASDQPDAPKGKFLKSASYKEPVFYPIL